MNRDKDKDKDKNKDNCLPPMTEGVNCDKGLCYIEMMFSYINDLLLEKKLITQPVKFSVHHVIQHIFNFSRKADNRLKIKAEFPLPISLNYIESYLISGSGPVLYEDDPCEITIASLKANNDKYKNKVIKVPYFIGTIHRVFSCENGIQKALEHNHLLAGSFQLLDGCLNKEKECYFHDIFYGIRAESRKDCHHCIKIINYDDNYSQENFNKTQHNARKNGAVLAEINCIEGMSRLWIGYEQTCLLQMIYIEDISINTKNIYNVYEYDILGYMNRMTLPITEEFINTKDNFYICRSGSMKNVFKTRNPGKEYLEYIKFMLSSVFSFEIIVMNGNEIVYHHICADGDDDEGCKYFSHKLDKPVLLTAESFSIEIKTKGSVATQYTDDIVDIKPNISFVNGVDITDKVTKRYTYNCDRVQGHCCIKALSTTENDYNKERVLLTDDNITYSDTFDESHFINTTSHLRAIVVEYCQDDLHNKLVKSICSKYNSYDDIESSDKMVLSLDIDEYVIGCSWIEINASNEHGPYEENIIGFRTNKREVNYDEHGNSYECDEGRMIVGFYGGILDGYVRNIGFYTIPTF